MKSDDQSALGPQLGRSGIAGWTPSISEVHKCGSSLSPTSHESHQEQLLAPQPNVSVSASSASFLVLASGKGPRCGIGLPFIVPVWEWGHAQILPQRY